MVFSSQGPNIFVFGSNLAGRHGKGAALDAVKRYGARRGVGEGRTGNAYAIPTKDAALCVLPLDDIERRTLTFLDYAHRNPQLTFELTAIGCGLTGYSPSQIAPFFVRATPNVSLPTEFLSALGRGKHVATIQQFRDEYDWLSNFYPARVRHRDWVYPTVEHGFQATKTVIQSEREWVQGARTPGEAKRRGKVITLRPGWNNIRDRVMLHFVQRKFEHPSLAERLMLTGQAELIEGNTWGDRYWGVCGGRGQNKLGHILMRVRADLVAVWQTPPW